MVRKTNASPVRTALGEVHLAALGILLALLVERCGEWKASLAVLTNDVTRAALARPIANRIFGNTFIMVRTRLVEFGCLHASVSLPIRMVVEWAAAFTFHT